MRRTRAVPRRRPRRTTTDPTALMRRHHQLAGPALPAGLVGHPGSFADVLRPGGWVVLSLDHPFGPALAGQRGGYFDAELVSDTWRKADVEVTQQFWRRSLGDTLTAFSDAGFTLDSLVEARPDASAVEQWPDELGPLVDVPTFIVYRLRLT